MGKRTKAQILAREAKINQNKKDKKSKNTTEKKKERKKRNNDPDEEEYRNMDRQLAAQGLQLKRVEGDGNCLFRSIADQLIDDQTQHPVYRQKTVQYIEEHKDFFAPFIVQESFENYCKRMKQLGTWAGNLELQAVSMCFNVNIVVHQLNMPKYEIANHSNARTIHLSYHNGEHYNSVRPMTKKVVQLHQISKDSELNDEKSKKERIVMESTQCKDVEHVRQVLKDHDWDVNAAIEYLVMEKHNFGKFEDEKEVKRVKDDMLNDLISRVMESTQCYDVDLIKTLLEQNNYSPDATVAQLLAGNFVDKCDSPKQNETSQSEPKYQKKLSKKEKRELKRQQQAEKSVKYLTKKQKNALEKQKRFQEFEKGFNSSGKSNNKDQNDDEEDEEFDEQELKEILKKTETIRI